MFVRKNDNNEYKRLKQLKSCKHTEIKNIIYVDCIS